MNSKLLIAALAAFLLFPMLVIAQPTGSSGTIETENVDKNPYRRGNKGGRAAVQAWIAANVWPEIEKHYRPWEVPPFFSTQESTGCDRNRCSGLCIKPTIPPVIKPRWSYYVPFQLTEHSNRPGTSILAPNQPTTYLDNLGLQCDMGVSQELERAHELLLNFGVDASYVNSVMTIGPQGITDFEPGDDTPLEAIKLAKSYDANFGDQEDESQSPMYSMVHDSEWNNHARWYPVFWFESSSYVWCHDYTTWAESGQSAPKPRVGRFSSLDSMLPTNDCFSTQETDDAFSENTGSPLQVMTTFYRFFTFLGMPGLLPALTIPANVPQNCAGKRKNSGRFPRETYDLLDFHGQLGGEASNLRCPGDGFTDEIEYTRYTNTLYRAFNVLASSAAILYQAYYSDLEDTKGHFQKRRHPLKATNDSAGEPEAGPNLGRPHHMQVIWPPPDPSLGEAWKGGCEDNFVIGGDSGPQSHYSAPKYDLPTDYIKAGVDLDEYYDVYIVAHYVNVVCCPAGYIPLPDIVFFVCPYFDPPKWR